MTVEENAVMGGARSAVNEFLAREGFTCRTMNLGIPDEFIPHGNPDGMLAQCGLDAGGIEASIRTRLKTSKPKAVSS